MTASRSRQQLGRTIAGLGQRPVQPVPDRVEFRDVFAENFTMRGSLVLSGEQLLENGTFETTDDPWVLADSGGLSGRSNAEAHSGSWSLKLHDTLGGGSNSASATSERMEARAGRTYRLLFWVNNQSVGEFLGVTATINFYNAAGTLLAATQVLSPSGLPFDTWRAAAGAAVAPEGTVEMGVVLGASAVNITISGSTTTLAYFDDIELEETSVIEGGYNTGGVADDFQVDNDLSVYGRLRLPSWGAYQPALTATSSNPNMGTSPTRHGRWKRIDDTIDATIRMAFGTGGSVAAGSGTYQFSLPTPCRDEAFQIVIGHGYILDNSANTRVLVNAVVPSSSNTLFELVLQQVIDHVVDNNSPWIWAASDLAFVGALRYEAAS